MHNSLSIFETNPRLKIIEYFDKLVNQIDICSEKLITKNNKLNLVKNDNDDINIIRMKLIEEIKQIEMFNLNQLEENNNGPANKDEDIFKCFSFFIEQFYLEKIPFFKLGVLVVIDWFMNQDQIEIFK
jgi:hypothetical protein